MKQQLHKFSELEDTGLRRNLFYKRAIFKKFSKKSFLLLLFCIGILSICRSQNSKQKNVLEYFKINPYEKRVNHLIKEIISDKDFLLDTLIVSSDSSLLYFRGYYKTFNPFTIRVRTVEMQIRQQIRFFNGVPTDTGIVYQIMGISDSTFSAKALVKEELRNIHSRFKNNYHKNQYSRSRKKDIYDFENYLYSNSGEKYPLVMIGWGLSYHNKKDYVITVKINLDME